MTSPTDTRPRVVVNRGVVTKLLNDLDLHSARDRAEYLGTSPSIANRMLREPTAEHPDEHIPSAETIAAVCLAFPGREFRELFTISGGTQ
jgi:hypothetical protein